jgi:hypothetical protein
MYNLFDSIEKKILLLIWRKKNAKSSINSYSTTSLYHSLFQLLLVLLYKVLQFPRIILSCFIQTVIYFNVFHFLAFSFYRFFFSSFFIDKLSKINLFKLKVNNLTVSAFLQKWFLMPITVFFNMLTNVLKVLMNENITQTRRKLCSLMLFGRIL